jgi:hypothetical protein
MLPVRGGATRENAARAARVPQNCEIFCGAPVRALEPR